MINAAQLIFICLHQKHSKQSVALIWREHEHFLDDTYNKQPESSHSYTEKEMKYKGKSQNMCF